MIPGLLGTISGGFRLTDIAGCVLWLNSVEIVGLSNGDGISQWNDLSGSGNDFAQADSGKRPKFMTGIQNGLPVVRFDGTDDLLQTATTFFDDAASDGSVVVVFSSAAAADIISTRILLGGWILRGNLYAHVAATPNLATGYVSGWSILSISRHGLDVQVRINGVVVADETLSSYTAEAGGTFIGCGPAGEPGAIDLGEMAAYSSQLPYPSLGYLEKVIALKWGITIDQSPVNTVVPALSAAGWTVGQVASCDTGTWTNTPTTFAYQWQRKDGGYTNIPGATSSSYLLAAADSGKNVRCGVTPSNAFATGTVAYSLDSDLIL